MFILIENKNKENILFGRGEHDWNKNAFYSSLAPTLTSNMHDIFSI